MVLGYVTERLQSSDLIGCSITAVVDLLLRWIAPLDGEGVAMLLDMVLHIRNCLFFCGKPSSREKRKSQGHYQDIDLVGSVGGNDRMGSA